MWLNEKMIDKGTSSEIESAAVTIGGNEIETLSSRQQRGAQVYTPYGYNASVPSGQDVLLISGAECGFVAGVKSEGKSLQSGEIEITSAGGASIKLCNDGKVVINGLIINNKGEIENGS